MKNHWLDRKESLRQNRGIIMHTVSGHKIELVDHPIEPVASNKRWKRMELHSAYGVYFIMNDDNLKEENG